MTPAFALACCLFISLTGHTAAQTIKLSYRYDSDNILPIEFIAFDFDTDSALRISASGECVLITPRSGWMEGQAGSSNLERTANYNHLDALRFASIVMPQLYLADAKGIDQPAAIQNFTNEFGGKTLAEEYPNGHRLFRKEDFPNLSTTEMQRVEFDLDTEGRLVQIRVPDSERITRFDLADESTAEISYVSSFGDGNWKLQDVQIDPSNDRSVFEPENVIERAREIAFAAAEAQRDRTTETASSEEGIREIRKRVSDTLDSGLSQSTKRFALILTGLLIIGVGSLAWWKNRS